MRIHLLMATAALALCAGSAQAEFSLHVLHINDFHSRIEPINKFDSTCTEKDAAEERWLMLAELVEKFVQNELMPLEPAVLEREARGEPAALTAAVSEPS